MKTLSLLLAGLGLLALASTPMLAQATPGTGPTVSEAGVGEWDGPLPRWREGGTPPENSHQSLHPYAVDLTAAPSWADAPTSGLIASPPEYSACDGVIFRWGAGWNDVVNACVSELTSDPTHDEQAWVVVTSAAQQASAAAAFVSAGADLSKVHFAIEPSDSIWLRDYGPHFIWQSGALAIADSHYYPTRPKDNFIPTLLARDAFTIPAYAMSLYYSGGNFQPGPSRQGFVTSLIEQDNAEYVVNDIEALYQGFQGIDTLHIMPRLPGTVDGTGHIDMWMYLVDDDSVIIGEFVPGSNQTAIDITNNAVPYMEALGFGVTRVPAWNVGSTHYTYTNAFRVNDRIFVPVYGIGNPNYLDEDALALAAWQAAAGPGVELVPIDCYGIIPAAGAIHCIMMQVPRYTAPEPAAHVVSMDGGEVVCSGTLQDLRWTACDDADVTAVDVALSVDGGASWPFTVAIGVPNTGELEWLVPDVLSTDARLRVTARDADAHATPAVSEASLEIIQAPTSTYDWSTGAGVDKWIWGSVSQNFTDISGLRYPPAVSAELTPSQYAALAASDASGGDADVNRYISPVPTGGAESTHVFDLVIAEPVALIRDLAITWEGYFDQCTQAELYVWDQVLGEWGDGAGNVGKNAFAACWAGNLDQPVTAHLQGDLSRVIDGAGHLTFLVYGDRKNDESFHDHVKVDVTWDASPWGLWTDDGLALDGAFGPPQLAGSGGLLGGDALLVRSVNAPAGVPAGIVLGLAQMLLPFKGGVMVPTPDVLLDGLFTDARGWLVLATTWPTGMPSGLSMFLQAWFLDPAGPKGFTASNAVTATTP